MIRLKDLLGEGTIPNLDYAGKDNIERLLNGYKKYSHNPNSIGYINKSGKVKVDLILTLLKKLGYRPTDKRNHGKKDFAGFHTWSFSKRREKYGDDEIELDSADGEHLRDLTAKVILPYSYGND